MSNRDLAKDIIDLVGGEENIYNLYCCATKLRFSLHDNEKADKEILEKKDGIHSVVVDDGQFYIAVGNHVSEIYAEIKKIANIDGSNSPEQGDGKPKRNIGLYIFERIFEFIAGSFTPLVPVLAGAGMLKALVIVFASLHILNTEEAGMNDTFAILSAAGNAVFYFLPVMLGVTSARKLGANGYVGGAIGAALLEPNFTNLEDGSSFIGIPVVTMDYSSTVFPIFIAIAVFALLERFLKKIIHKNLQLFLIPMLSLAIIVPFTVIVFGAFDDYFGNGVASGINYLMEANDVLAGAVLGGLMTFLVLLGLHWWIVPIMLENLANGGDAIGPLWAAATFAQIGVVFGVFVKTKNNELKSLAVSTAVPGLLGVMEPILYGILLRYKRTIPYVVVAGAIGGAINGLFEITSLSFNINSSILTIPINTPWQFYLIGILASLIIGFVLTYIFSFRAESSKAARKQ
ncbi:PTS transporter subunit EIIC [Paraliobacillus ryukyuensis]|uniref:PTS transporter subunit EIIC n=1 Tax=Paraliobacillus ryukyuensis TaxID=200904 RepID=UPI0015C4A35D|nr:PTS transporter subunit EIIC [Paraliobacillus ryukyuensis]